MYITLLGLLWQYLKRRSLNAFLLLDHQLLVFNQQAAGTSTHSPITKKAFSPTNVHLREFITSSDGNISDPCSDHMVKCTTPSSAIYFSNEHCLFFEEIWQVSAAFLTSTIKSLLDLVTCTRSTSTLKSSKILPPCGFLPRIHFN